MEFLCRAPLHFASVSMAMPFSSKKKKDKNPNFKNQH
jgi:hypothetical protein